MALVINHNLGAERTLNLLEKNQTALGKDLKAAASGAKINDASDGASEYSISRRLEIEERGLGQDIQNVKTGGDLLAVAEGGIREVVENLRDMKQLAINAANDTNTDADRATIEKEFSHRQETIKEIAATTNYNGKLLLAGDYRPPHIATRSEGGGKDYTKLSIAPAFSAKAGTTVNTNAKASNYVKEKGDSHGPLEYKNAPSVTSHLADYEAPTVTQYGWSANVNLDFSPLAGQLTVKDMDYFPFTILCQGCPQFIEVTFDSNLPNSQSNFKQNNDPKYAMLASYKNGTFTIGTKDISSIADIPQAIFDGIATARGASNTSPVLIASAHSLSVEKNGNSYTITKSGNPMEIYYGSMNHPNPQPEREYEEYVPGNPLVIHDTTHASNAINVYIDSMHPRAITGKVPMRNPNTWEIIAQRDLKTGEILKDNDGNPIPARYKDPNPTLEDAHVRTRREALEAIDILDMAMNYALDQITDIGAYRMRLEQDEDKITVQQESATGSKSTIQDADMAATMTNYTKHNVLTQAAQLMLAQSNQDASRVLSLLQ